VCGKTCRIKLPFYYDAVFIVFLLSTTSLLSGKEITEGKWLAFSNSDSINKSVIYKNALSWYPLDSNGVDVKSGNNLSLHHVSFVNDTVRGKVAEIHHTDTGYMEFSHCPIKGEQFTISTWFNWNSVYVDSWQVVFEFANENQINGISNNFYLSVNAGTYYGLVAQSFLKSWEYVGSAIITPVDTWIHLAITFDNSKITLYMNGESVGQGTMAHSMADLMLTRFFIGADPLPGRFWRALDARYDDFAVFSKVLSESQVYALAHDTLPVSVPAIPQVFEAEDYAFGGWEKANDDTIAYIFYSITPAVSPDEGETLLLGKIPGEGLLTLWARIGNTEGINTPFWIKMDESAWKAAEPVVAHSGWEWVPLSSANLPEGNHQFMVAAGQTGIQTDKFLATFDFNYDPEAAYVKNDREPPAVPSNVTSGATTVSSTLLKWNQSIDNNKVTSYDILSGSRIFAVTADTSVVLPLISSSTYNFSVRAKDADGNVSGNSSSIMVTTSPLIFTIDYTDIKQTIHHFGASDAWSVEIIGKSWPLAKREAIARYLFSNQMDPNGHPEGIGLSMWRVNIGDGSADQPNSGYSNGFWMRETSCFLKSNGNYDWSSQAGTQWFMNQAKNYGVKYFTGWVNSPPYFMTKNGYTFRTSDVSGYNLDASKYADFAEFLGNVAKHFQDAGTPFALISPVNEPQWSWNAEAGNASQAGSYCTNAEFASLVKAINSGFEEKGVHTKLLIPEAGELDYLTANKPDLSTSNQITNFWGKASASYIGNLSHMSEFIAGHSYWINGDVNTSVTTRQNLVNKMKLVNPLLQYWQTEFCLLEDKVTEEINDPAPMDYSLWLSRIIHFDLVAGNATGWSFWTALNKPAVADHANRFGLINWYSNSESWETATDGEIETSKNLWVLGNYSRFVKPGYRRVETSRSDGLNTISAADGQMASAFISPGIDTLVIVFINYAAQDQQITLNLLNLPANMEITGFTSYVTDATKDLEPFSEVSALSPVLLRSRSVTTLIGISKNAITGNQYPERKKPENRFIYPNPASSYIYLKGLMGNEIRVVFSDSSGKQIKMVQLQNVQERISVEDLDPGYYLVSVYFSEKSETTRLIVIR
jgi:O-glycosyl hydrolase